MALEVDSYSKLEVDYSRDQPEDTLKEVFNKHDDSHNAFAQHHPPQEKRRRICGLVPRYFYIVAAVLILLIACAAVGGGVGGSLSSKKSKPSESSTASPNNSTGQGPITAAPTATTTQLISTSTTVVSSTTLRIDCPSSNNSIYNAGGALFRTDCQNNFINANTHNAVDDTTSSLRDCIDLCAAHNLANRSAIAIGKDTVCNAVCWRGALDGDGSELGRCFGFATQNSSGDFVYGKSTLCYAAAWINQNLN